jgi:hypothetical protein
MVLICPYCDIEINETLIEQEDGCCPECGAIVTASTVISEEDEDEFADEFDDEDDRDVGKFEDFDDELDEYDDK